MQAKQTKEVFSIIKREGKENYWLKVGIAFVNKDGSLNVLLNAFPLNAELHIRDAKPKEAVGDLN